MLAYLKEENTYVQALLAHKESFQNKLLEEMKGRIKKIDTIVPNFLSGYWYYARFEASREYAIHCRRKGSMAAPEQIILDVNEEAKDHAYYQAASLQVSDDGRFLS